MVPLQDRINWVTKFQVNNIARYSPAPELANNLRQTNRYSYSPPRTESKGLLYRKSTILPGTYRELSVPELVNNLLQDNKFS